MGWWWNKRKNSQSLKNGSVHPFFGPSSFEDSGSHSNHANHVGHQSLDNTSSNSNQVMTSQIGYSEHQQNPLPQYEKLEGTV